jgi:hypothetical protein
LVERYATAKDQVVAIFHLGEEQLMPATVLAPFWTAKERNQALQPLVVATTDEIVGR